MHAFERHIRLATSVAVAALAATLSAPGHADQPTEADMADSRELVFFRATPDGDQRDALSTYFAHARPLAADAGSKDLLQRPVAEHIADDRPAAIIAVSSFPNEGAASEFFDRSEAYQDLVPLRDRAFQSLDVFVAGPGAPMASVADEAALVAFVVAPNPSEPDALARYQSASRNLADDAAVSVILQRPIAGRLVGGSDAGMFAVAAFPSRTAVDSFFDSDAYRSLLPDRAKAFTAFDAYLLGDR